MLADESQRLQVVDILQFVFRTQQTHLQLLMVTENRDGFRRSSHENEMKAELSTLSCNLRPLLLKT